MNSHVPQHYINGSQKIEETHRLRLACVYVRQSSLKQVRENTESQVNQYQLQKRAQVLGWPDDQIHVIDRDQGVSGSSSDGRLGFQELIGLVSMGKVGIIFGFEVSRLARNNADWYPLIQLADLFNVLIADNDAVYNPKDFNDRMMLGLKGTMSELELHLIRQRLDSGRMNRILRGEYRQPLPTGLVRDKDDVVRKDPDEQVRAAIQLVLDKFAELGSCSKVHRYLVNHQIRLPRRQSGTALHAEILWKKPAYSAVYSILKNPAYAGAFAHGRKQLDRAYRAATGLVYSGQRMRPMEEWIHLEQDVYPAYISWEQYLANQEQLSQNATSFDKARAVASGIAREGSALLQGLTVCGCCGKRMRVRYRRSPVYACSYQYDAYGGRSCIFVQAAKIDAPVIQAFFEAIAPAQFDALETLLEQQEAEREKLEQQWQQQLQRAEYDALRAQRQYTRVDPENRLVASTLEKRWEEALAEMETTRRNYERFTASATPVSISPKLEQQFRHLSVTLPDLWPELTNQQKKELLRTLISQVIITPDGQDHVTLKIVWVSGHYSTVRARRRITRTEHLPNYEEMLERIHQLWSTGKYDVEIAAQLNSEGFVTLHKKQLTRVFVLNIRLKQGWRHQPPFLPHNKEQTP